MHKIIIKTDIIAGQSCGAISAAMNMIPTEYSNSAHEQSLIEEVQNLTQSKVDRLKDWSALNHILLRAIRCNLNSSRKLRTHVSDLLLHLLSEQKLLPAWKMITEMYLNHSQVAAHKAAQQLMTEYRVVSNFYGHYGDFINIREYIHRITISLLSYIDHSNLNKASDELTAVAAIVKNLPPDFLPTFIDCICEGPVGGIIIIDHLPSDFILQTAYTFLKRKFSSHKRDHSSTATGFELSHNEIAFVEKLVAKALVGCFPLTVIDALLLQKPFTRSIAELVVKLLPESSYIDLLDSVGSFWGERLFVSKGDEQRQEYLTTALILTLRRTTGARCWNHIMFFFATFVILYHVPQT